MTLKVNVLHIIYVIFWFYTLLCDDFVIETVAIKPHTAYAFSKVTILYNKCHITSVL